MERHFVHEMNALHHHPGNPEEDDVETRDEHIRLVVALEFRRLVWPTKRRKRPERRGEPRIQDVLVARQRLAACHCNGLFLGMRAVFLAIFIVPDRDLMAPPELAGNTPGLNVVEPVEIDLVGVAGNELGRAVLNGFQGGSRQCLGIDKPLVRQHRLYDHLGAVSERLHDLLGLDQRQPLRRFRAFLQRMNDGPAKRVPFRGLPLHPGDVRMIRRRRNCQTFCGDLFDNAFARLEPVETTQIVRNDVDEIDLLNGHLCAIDDRLGLGGLFDIRRTIGAHRTPGVHQAVHRDLVALSDTIVVEIMCTGDLDRPRAEIRIRIFVGDDRDQTAMFLRPDRDFAEFADNWLVTLIVRMNGNGTVTQHGFRPRRGNRNIVTGLAKGDVPLFVFLDVFIGRATGQRVAEVPHVSIGFDVLDLEIRNGCLHLRIPVDEPLGLVDQALVVEVDKNLANGLRQAFVHGEPLTRPVA